MTRSKQFGLITVIVLLAAVLRGCAVVRLPLDFDEPVYFIRVKNARRPRSLSSLLPCPNDE